MKNRSYIITVSEPWDFNNSNNENIISLLFKAIDVLNFDNIKGDVLVLLVRSGDINSFLDFGTTISINGGLLLSEYRENLSINFLKENSKFVLIGSLSKEE